MPWGDSISMGVGNQQAAVSSSRNAYTNIALMAGLQALAVLTAPGPKRPGKDNIKVNYADAAQVWPYIAGTVKMFPHLIWWGDYHTKKVKNADAIENIAIATGLGGLGGYLAAGGHFNFPTPDPPSAYIGLTEGAALGGIGAGIGQLRTASYKHLAGFAYGICHGPIDGIRTIWIDEKVAYSGSTSNAGNTILIDQKKLWGGDHELGGVYATCDIVPGNFWPAQLPNVYLASQVSSVTAYSGKALFVMRGPTGNPNSGYFAATPSDAPLVRPIALEVVRFPNNLGVPEFKACGSDSLDANPAEIFYEWTTNTVYGGKLSSARVDMDAAREAAETYFNEGMGMSYELNREYDVESALDDITAISDSVIYGSLHSGTMKIKPIRRTYSIASLPVFKHGDDSSVTDKSEYNVLEIESHEMGTWKGTANDFRLEYINRSNKYQVEKQPAYDQANRLIQNKTVLVNKSFKGVSTPAAAALVATREMRAASFPRPTFTIYVNRDGYDKEPADVVKLISYKYGWTKVLRVLEVGIGKEDDSRVRLVCAEDLFGVGAAAFASSSSGTSTGTSFTYPLDPVAVTDYLVQDAPYFLTKDDDPKVLVFASKPNSAQIKYDVQVATTPFVTYAEEAPDADYAIKGTISEAVERLTDVKVTSLTFTPADDFDVTRLESVSAGDIALGENLIYWPDTGEWGAVETIVDNGDGTYTLGNVWRAVGGFDSVPAPHDAGATVWFFTYGRALTAEHAAATPLALKLISNAPGSDYALLSATAISHTTSARALKPLPVRGVTVNGSYLTETVASGDLTVAWEETNRIYEGAVVLQTDPGVDPEDNTEYEIKIYGETGTLIRTVSGLTSPTYTYTNATEISDAGAIQDQLLFLITTIRDTTIRSLQTYVRRVLRTSAETTCVVTVGGVNATVNGDLVVAGCRVTVNGVNVTVNGETVWA